MKSIFALVAVFAALTSCSFPRPAATAAAQDKSFAAVRTILETNCVHCHGDNRLSTMPPINDTRALAKLVGVGNWIIPGNADGSPFYRVITFPDEVPGAMPPTGHAMSKKDAAMLRAWIQAGAVVPPKPVIKFVPRGEAPRSI